MLQEKSCKGPARSLIEVHRLHTRIRIRSDIQWILWMRARPGSESGLGSGQHHWIRLYRNVSINDTEQARILWLSAFYR